MGDATERLAGHYIRAYGLHAIYIAQCGRKQIIGTTGNLNACRRRLRYDHGRDVDIAKIWWCASAAEATAVVAAVLEAADMLPTRIVDAAQALGVRLMPHDIVIDRAREAVAAVYAEIAEMKRRGDMRTVNAAYRERRLKRAALGLGTEPYAVYLRRHATGMIYTMAAEVRRKAG